jgi:hypothetical protein
MGFHTGLEVVGDELQFEGLVVGMLAQSGIPATIMDRALDFIGPVRREEVEQEILDECSCKHLKECPLHRAEIGTSRNEFEEDDRDQLLAILTKRAKNGLLRLTDVADVINGYMDGEL